MDSDADIEAKQVLLQNEIINKQHDKDKFIEFCLTKKENGDDLSIWTLDELSEIIAEYIQLEEKEKAKEPDSSNPSQSPEPQAESPESADNSAPKDAKEAEKKKEKEKIPEKVYEYHKDILSETVPKDLKCKKLEKSPLNDKEIIVTVRDPKAIETSFLTTNYVNYEVETELMNWVVRRRYSDFLWLRNTLIKFHTGSFVPLLPNKKMGTRRFEPDFVEKRMRYLQIFINEIMKNEEFKALDPLIAFLSMNNRSQFEAKMKELTTFQPSPYIEETKTLNGIVKVTESDSSAFNEVAAYYYHKQNETLTRLDTNLKYFYRSFNQACTSLENVTKDFEELVNLNSKITFNPNFEQAYRELGTFLKDWRSILIKQNTSIKLYIKDFLKKMKMDGTSYEEIIARKDAIVKNYNYEKTKLINKKEKLFADPNKKTDKWELNTDDNTIDFERLTKDKDYAFTKMCHKENVVVENIKNQLDYANQTLVYQLKFVTDKNWKDLFANFKNFSVDFYPTLNDGISIYSNLQVYVATAEYSG